MILLTDETMSNMVTDYHFSGVQNRNVLCKKVAKAQLKQAHDKIESMVADGWFLADILKAILDEVKDV